MEEKFRVDKWLWAVRIFKTRSQATEACKKGRVMIAGMPVKASREIHPGEIVKVKMPPITRSFKVLHPAGKRVSAKLAVQLMEEVTPPEEQKVIEIQKQMNLSARERGTGRPTKKERRKLDDLFDF